MQAIQFFSLARQIKSLEAEIQSTVNQVIASQQFIGGTYVEAFEKKVAHYLNANHVIACNSGTDALWLALKALDIKENAIVLTTPFSFIASSSEIVAHNANPVFIDIDKETFNICPQKLTNWLETNAKIVNGTTIHQATGLPVSGIIAVDLFGQCAEYTALKQIAQAWNLWIIEDTAQAMGAMYQENKAGTLGTIGCFSFYPTKNLGAFGDAGCCSTNDPLLAEKLLRLRNHGRGKNGAYNYVEKGINSRLDGLQAAILSLKLDYLEAWNNRRSEIAARYNAAFAGHPLIKVPRVITGQHVYHQYSLELANPTLRNELRQYLTEQGIGTNAFYPKSLQDIDFLNPNPALATECPVARNLAETVMQLPVWPELTDQEIEHIIKTVKEAPILTAGMTHHHQQTVAAR